MIDDRKDDEKRDADAKAPADELFLDRQERLGFDFAELIAKIGFRHEAILSTCQLASGGFTPLKKSQEISSPTQITKPNRLTR
jgi:hypothetical protein